MAKRRTTVTAGGSTATCMQTLAYNFRAFFDAGTNWSLVYTEGDWSVAANILSGDYCVFECATAWSDGRTQQLLFAVNFGAGAATFGGVGDNVYTIAAYKFGFVYSPDGGWDVPTKLFAPTGGLAEVQSTMVSTGGVANYNWAWQIIDCEQAVVLAAANYINGAIAWSNYNEGVYAGLLISSNPPVDTKPCMIIVGNPALRGISSTGWGYQNAVSANGRCPNSGWISWDYCCTVEPSALMDGWGQAKNGTPPWCRLPLTVRDLTTGRLAGSLAYMWLVDANCASGDVASDSSTFCLNGKDWPWSVTSWP